MKKPWASVLEESTTIPEPTPSERDHLESTRSSIVGTFKESDSKQRTRAEIAKSVEVAPETPKEKPPADEAPKATHPWFKPLFGK